MMNFKARKGFTILEILVVVAVMSIIATLTTGAVLKALKIVRGRRIETMRAGLEMAIKNYRGQQEEWPFEISDLQRKNNSDRLYSVGGGNSAKNSSNGQKQANALQNMLDSDVSYLDGSAFLTEIIGKGRMSVQDALESGQSLIPIGHPDAINQDIFKYYRIQYNLAVDDVDVFLQ